MDGSLISATADAIATSPEALTLIVLGGLAVTAAFLYHLRECANRRRDIYDRMGRSERLLHRIAGKLGVDEPE